MTTRALYTWMALTGKYAPIINAESWGLTDIFATYPVNVTTHIPYMQSYLETMREHNPHLKIHLWALWSRSPLDNSIMSPTNTEHKSLIMNNIEEIISECDFDGVTMDDPIVISTYYKPVKDDPVKVQALSDSLTSFISDFVDTVHSVDNIPVSGNTPRYNAPNSQADGLMNVREINECFDYITVGLTTYLSREASNGYDFVKEEYKKYIESGNHLGKKIIVEMLSFDRYTSKLKTHQELNKELKLLLNLNPEGYAVCFYDKFSPGYVFPQSFRESVVYQRRNVVDRRRRTNIL